MIKIIWLRFTQIIIIHEYMRCKLHSTLLSLPNHCVGSYYILDIFQHLKGKIGLPSGAFKWIFSWTHRADQIYWYTNQKYLFVFLNILKWLFFGLKGEYRLFVYGFILQAKYICTSNKYIIICILIYWNVYF